MLRNLRRLGQPVLAATGIRSRAVELPDAASFGAPTGQPSTRAALGEQASVLAGVRLTGAVPRLALAPRGDGHLVVDIPGWRAPELSGAPLRRYLRVLGYDARGWGFGVNRGDPRRDIDRMAECVLDLAAERGSAVSLVGWSLGGVIAREVARRHPAAVRRVITYGTPVVGGSAHTSIARVYRHDAGDRVIRRRAASAPIPVPLTAIFSRRDGVVSWQACLDPSSSYVEHVEVFSTHLGMGLDPDVWALVAHRLAADSGEVAT